MVYRKSTIMKMMRELSKRLVLFAMYELKFLSVFNFLTNEINWIKS